MGRGGLVDRLRQPGTGLADSGARGAGRSRRQCAACPGRAGLAVQPGRGPGLDLGAVGRPAPGAGPGPVAQPRPARGPGQHRQGPRPVRHCPGRPAARRQRQRPGQPQPHGGRPVQQRPLGRCQPVHRPAGHDQLRARPLGPGAQPQRSRAAGLLAVRREPAQCAAHPGGRCGQCLADACRRPGAAAAGAADAGRAPPILCADRAHACAGRDFGPGAGAEPHHGRRGPCRRGQLQQPGGARPQPAAAAGRRPAARHGLAPALAADGGGAGGRAAGLARAPAFERAAGPSRRAGRRAPAACHERQHRRGARGPVPDHQPYGRGGHGQQRAVRPVRQRQQHLELRAPGEAAHFRRRAQPREYRRGPGE
ncbi:hypothetical protein D3C78_975570 [compost metagenome]